MFRLFARSFTPLFHKTGRACLIFLSRRRGIVQAVTYLNGYAPPKLLALHKNLRRNHFPLL